MIGRLTIEARSFTPSGPFPKERGDGFHHRLHGLPQINAGLIKITTEGRTPNVKVIHRPATWKLQCTADGATVKIEVNGTKRGIIGDVEVRDLCSKAQNEFKANCKANIVSLSQLYGGKITAALSRQHPRDLFDYKYMKVDSFDVVKRA